MSPFPVLHLGASATTSVDTTVARSTGVVIAVPPIHSSQVGSTTCVPQRCTVVA